MTTTAVRLAVWAKPTDSVAGETEASAETKKKTVNTNLKTKAITSTVTAVKPTKNNNKCCNSRATSTIKVPLVINNNNKNKCNTNNNKCNTINNNSVSHKAQVRLQTEKIGPTPTIVLPLICCCCGFYCSYSYFRWCWCCVRCQQIAKGHNTIHKQTITQEYCFCGRRSFVPPGAYTSVCVCACV